MSRLPNYSIVTRNGRIVWKHWPNGLLYALMLRIKLYQNPFFSTVHQNINKQKIKAVTTVFELPCYFPMWLKSRFFLSSIEIQICEDQTLSKKAATHPRSKLYQIQNRGSNQQIILFYQFARSFLYNDRFQVLQS